MYRDCIEPNWMPYREEWHNFKNRRRFIRDLQMGLEGEAAAIEMYAQLMEMAPTPEQRQHIRHAYEDERKHFRIFSDLYLHLTGRMPSISEPMVKVEDYKQGIAQAFNDELEAAELYRGMLLNTYDPAIRDAMFEIMTDEMEHADRFNFIFAQLT